METIKSIENSLGLTVTLVRSTRPILRSARKFAQHLKTRFEKQSRSKIDIFLFLDMRRKEWVYVLSPKAESLIKPSGWKVIQYHLREELQGTYYERAVSANLKLIEALAAYPI